MQVYVRLPSGKTVPVDVAKSQSTLSVKQSVCNSEELSLSGHQLVYNEKALTSGTIGTNEIDVEACLALVPVSVR